MHPWHVSLRFALGSTVLLLNLAAHSTSAAAGPIARLTALQRATAVIETRLFAGHGSEGETPFVASTYGILSQAIEHDRLDPPARVRLTVALSHCQRSSNFALAHDADQDDVLALYGVVVDEQQLLLAEIFPTLVTTERGLKQNIVTWANEAVGVSSPLYGVQTHTDLTGHPDYPNMFPGYLSCARVASAILQKAGAGKGIHSACLAFDRALSGWKKIGPDSLEWGDVVFWAGGADDVRPRHTGIHAGSFAAVDWTVDNNSLLGRVVKRPLRRPEWDVFHGRRPPN